MDTKKFVKLFVIMNVTMLLFFGGIVWWYDPIFKFHKPIMKPKYFDEIYQNSGIANNFDYDSVIIGSSMTENFKISSFNKAFNSNAIKLSYSGMRAKNLDLALSQVLKSKNKVNTILIGLDDSLLGYPKYEFRFDIPTFVYKSDFLSSLKYVFNKELLIKAYEAEANDPDCPYCWYDTVNFGKKYWINDYQYNDYSNVPIKQLSDEEKEIIDKNVSGLINTIKMNPDTNFKIFIPPYSIIYWYLNKGEGKIIYQLDVQLYVYKKLLKFENVKIYYFQNDLNIVENLDNYKDYSHYSESISEYILAAIANEKNILTKDNIDNTLQQFRNYLVTYDFSKIFD